ncbi:MAG: LamG domain-containing protein, partial [Candidatus Marinimicrobia bacterium]|nr:LamG domain-containing protein [Candidatus Neomarinimicrobiota bacterium]
MKKLLFVLGSLVIGFGIQVNAQNTQSAFFDGSHARIRVADASPVNPNAIPSAYQISGTAITVEAWIFPMDLPTGTDSRYIIARPANTGFGVDPYQTFALFIYGNAPFSHQPRIGISISDGTHPVGTGYEVFVEDTAAVKIGQWTHVAGTYDGTNVKLYINSILVHHLPLNVTMGSGSTGLYIGGVAGGYFKGIIDEVRLWNTTRTQEEIQASMNETLAGTESGLNGYWPMDSVYTTSSGILATIDKTPNHNDLAVQYDAKLVPFPQGSTVHIAPTYVRSSNDHALIGELFTEKLYSNGWPVPSISVTQKPSGMIIAGDSLFWTPQENQFGSFAVVATTSNSSGAIVDTVYVFSEAIRSAQNQVCVDVTHRGKMGAWGLYGKGIFYKSKNGLYAGDFSLVDRNNAKFAGGLYSKSTSFNPIEGFTTVSSRFPGFTAFKTSFADEWETNRIGVRVFQTVNSSTTTGDDKYAVIEYQVVNESGAPIGDLFAQLSADFDIGTAENNLGKYDSLL